MCSRIRAGRELEQRDMGRHFGGLLSGSESSVH